jgi:hypothetical protein
MARLASRATFQVPSSLRKTVRVCPCHEVTEDPSADVAVSLSRVRRNAQLSNTSISRISRATATLGRLPRLPSAAFAMSVFVNGARPGKSNTAPVARMPRSAWESSSRVAAIHVATRSRMSCSSDCLISRPSMTDGKVMRSPRLKAAIAQRPPERSGQETQTARKAFDCLPATSAPRGDRREQEPCTERRSGASGAWSRLIREAARPSHVLLDRGSVQHPDCSVLRTPSWL